MTADHERFSDVSDLLTRAGELSPKTVIVDVEPLVAKDGGRSWWLLRYFGQLALPLVFRGLRTAVSELDAGDEPRQ